MRRITVVHYRTMANDPRSNSSFWIHATLAVILLCCLIIAVIGFWPITPTRELPPEQWDAQTRAHVNAELQRAEKCIDFQKYREAGHIVEQLLADYPLDIRPKILGMKLAIARQKWDLAGQLAQKGLQLAPQNPECHFFLAQVQRHAGRLDAAIAGLQQAAKLDPTIARFPFFLGQCYLQTDQPKQAETQLLQALQLEKRDHHIHQALAQACAVQGRHDEAAAHLADAIALLDDRQRVEYEPIYMLARAKALRLAGQPRQALTLISSYAGQAPADYQNDLMRQTAACYLALDAPLDAAEFWDRIARADPNDAQALAQAGLCYLQADRADLAERYLEKAMQIKAWDPTVQQLAQKLAEQQP